MSRRKSKLIALDAAEIAAIVERTKTSALDAEDHEKLHSVVETLFWVTAELEKSNATLERLRKDLSINTKKTEKTSEVLKGRMAQNRRRVATVRSRRRGSRRDTVVTAQTPMRAPRRPNSPTNR